MLIDVHFHVFAVVYEASVELDPVAVAFDIMSRESTVIVPEGSVAWSETSTTMAGPGKSSLSSCPGIEPFSNSLGSSPSKRAAE